MTDHEILSRELLTYLARIPSQITEKGPNCIGEISVQLGNALVCASAHLEAGKPRLENHPEELPESLFALGKQLRAVGLKHWDSQSRSQRTRLDRLESQLEESIKRQDRFETLFNVPIVNGTEVRL